MKIYVIPFFCLILAACGTPPKLEYPSGSNRVPINIRPDAIQSTKINKAEPLTSPATSLNSAPYPSIRVTYPVDANNATATPLAQ